MRPDLPPQAEGPNDSPHNLSIEEGCRGTVRRHRFGDAEQRMQRAGALRREARVMFAREDNHRDKLRPDPDHLGALGQLVRLLDDDTETGRVLHAVRLDTTFSGGSTLQCVVNARTFPLRKRASASLITRFWSLAGS